jgi:tetratricopeptide (TPR) repeat protein
MRSVLLVFLLTSFVSTAEARRKKAGEISTNSAEEIVENQEDQLSDIRNALKKNKPAEAAKLLSDFFADENNRGLFSQAYALQMRTYEKLRLPFVRFQMFPTLLSESLPMEDEKEFLEDLIDLSEELGEEGQLPTLLTDKQVALLKKSDQDLVTYHKAKNALRASDFVTALELSKSIGSESEYYTKALNIEAVTLSQQGRFDEALLPFNRALSRLKDSEKETKLRNIVQLNLARNYYAAGIFSAAMEGFDAVPRTSPYWLEAQFEKAWALFRVKDINPMLSILQTHTTEFFVDGVYPEEEMLRIYGFFLLCKFENTSTAVDVFEERYNKHLITLREWNQKSEAELFSGFANRKKGTLPRMLSRHFEFEDQMNEAVYTTQAIDREIEILNKLGSFTEKQIDQLRTRKDNIVQHQGSRIKTKGQWKEEQIVGMLQNMKITRLDIGELKQRILNKEAVIGKQLSAKRQAKRRIRAKRNYNVWTYQGEQWADELGYYQIKVPSDCPSEF